MYSRTRTQAEAVEALWHEPCLAAKVRRLHRVVVGAYDEALRPYGLTVAQLDLLMTILNAGTNTRPIDLARILQMDRSTVTRNLDRLQTRDLVTSTSGRNGRESQVTVTPAGRRAVTQAAKAWFAAQHATRAKIGTDGIDALDLLTLRLTN